MFEEYSDRSRRIVFLSRKIAGQRGGTAIEVEDLIEALVIEDQGNFTKAFLQDSQPGARFVGMVPKHQPFFSAKAAEAIHRGLETLLLPDGKPLADSVDMQVSEKMKGVLQRAQDLSEKLRQDLAAPARLEPLHLLAAVLSDDSSDVAKNTDAGRC
jgi:hypothetical protein